MNDKIQGKLVEIQLASRTQDGEITFPAYLFEQLLEEAGLPNPHDYTEECAFDDAT